MTENKLAYLSTDFAVKILKLTGDVVGHRSLCYSEVFSTKSVLTDGINPLHG
ncbi:MAG: hypothetical protein IKQ36_08000 [Clostridia bacterium]|nr:hypothetical protein [Clostridia bacterium]